ncbi:alpha/beta fold hydrolase [Altererythrobacter lutimaris]|uniref:Alpha/beta fold hydrolase n=1 Tax=Altererythrobacter lutimaris TaxID=2743979 RepID=A0A850H2X2_9SPHN|nr:alpha/beta fold hydrolase [Altererythrobacter lutimaris]
MSSPAFPTDVHRIDVGDAELHVEITGEGPDVLLVAGLGGRGAFWTNQIQAFARHFRVITFDHRGCGSSTRGKTVQSVAHMASDVTALMDALDIRSAHLVGHSTGGAIGQHIGVETPERLDKLVLSCSWPGPDAYFLELFRMRRAVLEQCGPLDYLSSGTFLAMPSRYLQPQMENARSYMEERLSAFPGVEVEISRISAVMSHDLREKLTHLALSTLCLGALDDQITPAGFTKEMTDLIPGAELHLFDNGGHFAPMCVPEEYNARVLEFLQS